MSGPRARSGPTNWSNASPAPRPANRDLPGRNGLAQHQRASDPQRALNSTFGSADSTRCLIAANWSGWTSRPGSFRRDSAGSFKCGMTPAALLTATRPSATTATSSAGTMTDKLPAPTAKASAKPATTSKKHPAGQPRPSPGPQRHSVEPRTPHRPHVPLDRPAPARRSPDRGLPPERPSRRRRNLKHRMKAVKRARKARTWA
jgi:hypothetical protein